MEEEFKKKIEEQVEQVTKHIYDQLLELSKLKNEIGRLRDERDTLNKLLGKGRHTHNKVGRRKKQPNVEQNVLP